MKRTMIEMAHVDAFGYVPLPSVQIGEHRDEYVYRPMRGTSQSVAVEGIDGTLIGWMDVRDLPGGPYQNAREWIKAVGYIATPEERARDADLPQGGPYFFPS